MISKLSVLTDLGKSRLLDVDHVWHDVGVCGFLNGGDKAEDIYVRGWDILWVEERLLRDDTE